ncbi:MAG: hypothetical protein MASP_00740 [Candidatus Methanolliviera sp. GoM_asphalt]|nr:MAG: hypothetical protein MASP_00740 [Candidatus Methanolliviera sp. GoM_asphalt]
MEKMKKERVIFDVTFGVSILVGMIVASFGYYWLGIAIAFVGGFGVALHARNVAARYKLGDERAEFISGKASSLTFKVISITMGILLVILGGLSIRSIEISAYSMIGLLLALTCIVHLASRHYYTKKYS